MRTGEEQDKEEHDINLMEICHSGTDRHLRIQHLVESMEGVKTLDLEEMVKEAQAKGINTDFVGWNEDHTEARCKNDELSIWFQPDGVLNFMGKDVILEIKTESTYQHSKRYEPKMDHKYQASALMKAFCDKAVPLCKKSECTFLMINQLRENIGNMYKPYKIPCGTAIAHACSQILWFTKGSLLDEKGEEKSSTYSDPVGNVVNVRVEKNKVTKNDRRLDSYTLNYFRGVDDGTDTIDLGIKLNVIEQSGAWFKVPVSDGSEKKLQGRAGVINYFYNDLDEFDWLKAKVNERAME